MKNILVCTDFSPNAQHAAVFAANLARKSGARLILFHAYHPAVLLEEDTIWADPELLESEVQEKIDQQAHQLHRDYKVSVTRILKPGFPVEEISALAHKVKADLVVLGWHGAGKRPKSGAGKVSAEILKKVNFPVYAVPNADSLKISGSEVQVLESELLFGNSGGLELLNRYGQPAALAS